MGRNDSDVSRFSLGYYGYEKKCILKIYQVFSCKKRLWSIHRLCGGFVRGFGVVYRCYVGWQKHRQGAKVSSGKRGGLGGRERDPRGEPLRSMAEAPGRGKRCTISLIIVFTSIYLGHSRQRVSSADPQG